MSPIADYHLGVNLGHERSAALVRDGRILLAIEEERLDRQKHSIGYLLQAPSSLNHIQPPHQSIRYLLDSQQISLKHIHSIIPNMPGLPVLASDIFSRSYPAQLAKNVIPIHSHHLAHAYSAYWPSGFESAIILVADASGSTDWNTHRTESYTLYQAHGCQISTIHQETVPSHLAALSTLGFIYEHVTRMAGFASRVGNSAMRHPEAGKLMGLAPYGGPQNNLHAWINPKVGSYSLSISPYDIFLELEALKKKYDTDVGKPYLRPYLVDLAYKVQQELESALLHIVGLAMQETGLKKLCIAGGVGLNSVANYHLLNKLNLDDIFIFPAAGDSGIAAGAALWSYAQMGGTNRPQLMHANLGHAYTTSQVDCAVCQFSSEIDVVRLSSDDILNRSAEALTKGNIVARFEGRSEYGPRALGHRSIIADPTFLQMRDIVNARVKFREAFRPFAPVVPLESVSEVFQLSTTSPFMLLVAPIRQELQTQIPAVTHVDGTGRVQTVTANDNPYFHQLCYRLVQLRKGPPVLLNTSFNVAGQPIVETPTEALETFLNTDIDYLAMENLWISKRHVKAKMYNEHLAKVKITVMPKGLPPNQPSVTDLMAQLDKALFTDCTEGCPWSETELKLLSTIGGRYKETSILFPDTPFLGGFTSQVSEDIVWILNPKQYSTLIDLSLQNIRLFNENKELPGREDSSTISNKSKSAAGDNLKVVSENTKANGKHLAVRHEKRKSGLMNERGKQYKFEEVKLLMAMVSGKSGWQEQIRLELQLTHAELDEKLIWTRDQLAEYGIKPAITTLETHGADSAMPKLAAETLNFFNKTSFSLRIMLGQFRRKLQEHGYTNDSICSRLRVNTQQRIEPTRLHYYDQYQLGKEAVDDLIRLFLLRVALPTARLRTILSAPVAEALVQLGILYARIEYEKSETEDDTERETQELASRIDLFCVQGLYIATDHRYMLLKEDRLCEDAVMYIGSDSQGLVHTAPRYRVKSLLDMCCGSGVQGLIASRYSSHVICVDYNQRAVRFSRFNAQLNDVRNVNILHGNLFDTIPKHMKFDTILANPPFVASPSRSEKFRDGGHTGEEILSAIISGSEKYLTREGQLIVVTDLADVDSYEEKLRRWWKGGVVDLLVLCTADRDDMTFAEAHCRAPFGQTIMQYKKCLGRWVENLREAKIGCVNFGYIIVQGRREEIGGDGSYFRRTIHNPTNDIHEVVMEYFQQTRLLENGDRNGMFLETMKGLRMKTETGLNENEPGRKIEITVSDNAYFTTYEVGEEVLLMLQTVHRIRPRWDRYVCDENFEIVEDLIRKGLIKLCADRQRREESVEESAGKDYCSNVTRKEIVEHRTETTPTCLSSYLS